MYLIQIFFTMIIEWSSFLDICSDILIVYALGVSKDTAWFAFSLSELKTVVLSHLATFAVPHLNIGGARFPWDMPPPLRT